MNGPTGAGKINALFIGDSITECHGPVLETNCPISALLGQVLAYDVHPGMIPVGGDAPGIIPKQDWSLNGSGFTTVNDFGPFQLGVAGDGTTFVISGTNIASMYQGPLNQNTFGDGACVQGESIPGDTGLDFLVDGVIVGTAGAYVSGPPAIFTTCFTFPLGYHQGVSVAAHAQGIGHLYGVGFTVGTAGIYLNNIAHGAFRSEAYGAAAATQLAYVSGLSPAPSIALIALGINDSIQGTGVTATQYTTNMQNIVAKLLSINPKMKIIIMDENNVAYPGVLLPQTTIRTIEQNLAASGGFSYASIADVWGSYDQANAAGLMSADGIHPSDAGGVSIASIYNQTMFGSSGLHIEALPPSHATATYP